MIKFQDILRHLSEDVEGDKYWRDEARDVYDEMIEYLKNDGELLVAPHISSKMFQAEIRLNNFYDIEWSLGSGESPLAIKFMDINKKPGFGEYKPSKVMPILTMYVLLTDRLFEDLDEKDLSQTERFNVVNSESFQDKIRDQIVDQFEPSGTFRETFIHEIIHHFDFRRSGLSKDEWLDREDYYKDDKEINAFFQSLIDGIEENPEMYEDHIEDWKNDFKSFRDWFFNMNRMRKFKKSMSDSQYRRVVKRLYNFWNEYLSD